MLYEKSTANKLKNAYASAQGLFLPPWNYYLGKTDVGTLYNKTDRSDRVYQHNYIRQFVDEETSYQVGMPINYTSRSNNVQAIKDINKHFSNVSATIDIDLAKYTNILGECYEFYYMDTVTKEFKIKKTNPTNSICYCDIYGNVKLFMYCYYEELDISRKKHWELVDDKYIYHFNDSWKEIEEKTPHFFGFVPVGVSKFDNDIKDTLFSMIKNPQDIYNYLISDWSNEIGDNRQAYMIMENVDLAEKTIDEIKEKGIIQLDGEHTDARWMIKNLSPEFYSAYREILKQDIYSLAQHIDNQTQIQSNTSGTMLSTRINVLRIKITSNNQALKNCIKMRLKCLFKYLQVVENKDYDYRDIDIKFQLNLPHNNYEVAQISALVKDMLPHSILAEQFDFIQNGQVAIDMKMEEDKKIIKAQTEGTINLDKVGV